MPHGQQGHASAYERPVRQSSAMYGQQQAVRTPQAERPVSPRLDFGTTTQRETTGTATRRPMVEPLLHWIHLEHLQAR